MPPDASRFEIGLLYLSGVAQGLALVTFPAASTIFTDPNGFNLSSTQYGAMFIPQVVLAILASAFGSRLARRFGLRGVLLFGLCGDLAAMALLAGSPSMMGTPAAYVVLCAATGALGAGFGATVMALNTLVEGFFPRNADGAVLLLNALLGVGTALAPVLVALFTALGLWWALPLLMVVLLAGLLGGTLRAQLRLPYNAAGDGGLPPRFWLYAAAVLLYGVAETLCGNWATLYLAGQRGVSGQKAAFALTAFWVMVTLGRVLIAVLERIVASRWIYLALPVLLGLAFQIVANAGGAASGIAAFAAAGFACSAFLPLSISFAGAEFPRQAATMSGALIAFYQVGYGIAAFGVGPLRQRAGLDYSVMFSGAGIVALALAFVAFTLIRHPARDVT
jgi:FHS family glucose/mannose:H+ symporter-like MFS transporter